MPPKPGRAANKTRMPKPAAKKPHRKKTVTKQGAKTTGGHAGGKPGSPKKTLASPLKAETKNRADAAGTLKAPDKPRDLKTKTGTVRQAQLERNLGHGSDPSLTNPAQPYHHETAYNSPRARIRRLLEDAQAMEQDQTSFSFPAEGFETQPEHRFGGFVCCTIF